MCFIHVGTVNTVRVYLTWNYFESESGGEGSFPLIYYFRRRRRRRRTYRVCESEEKMVETQRGQENILQTWWTEEMKCYRLDYVIRETHTFPTQ